MSRKSVTQQLEEAKTQHALEIAELKEYQANMVKYHSEQRAKAEDELEQIHVAIDLLPNAPPRKVQREGFYGDCQVKASARLSVLLATWGRS